MQTLTGNFAYIDNQNLYMATTKNPDDPWTIDMRRLRRYLYEKYRVIRAYLFMGAFDVKLEEIYRNLQDMDYELVFREHGKELVGKKKGNVDVDVVFEMMRDNFTNAQMEKAILVSGDGDYFRTVDFLLSRERFERILLPSRRNASSLYKAIPERNKAFLDEKSVREKIGRKRKGGFA